MAGLFETDVAIIGAGPVGLFTIFECGMLKMQCHVIDSLEMVGGQCTALYPEKPIYDIPGFPKILAADLIDNLKEQAAPFNPTYHLNQQVSAIQKSPDNRWLITTSQETKIKAKAIIIAAGVGAFGPNRPPLENIEHYEGHSVFYYVKKREDFRDQNIVIAGGGDSAVDWAISLSEIAKRVYVIHRRPKFRAAPESVARLEELVAKQKIEMVIPYQLEGLEGVDKNLHTVIVKTLDGAIKKIEADCLLPFFGLAMNLGPIAEWGLNLERHHILVNPSTTETSTPGIYAVGDIAIYPKKLKLILSGFAEAAQAAHAAREIVFPGEALHFEYSTTHGVPGHK
ncbi:NAD(P)/FAD-dependent oxidoreductase [Candidatus Nucleicultrix amoebiphila]|uniref:Ferredoxin--NADP reductase n=1 Tax=Candidatus Nucleicultrix amoebiphila FS5 TaxID=1414854 RepID=A0A1W6N5X4_9PROT|nr:NAD(P)/FAD-dependent oxidoreductase [Candidatus Nucleicultrix amoebiphila]ARN85136.1 ferredoxin-NADP reductase [Candidatus Nucleicultrix amoebiphila FS5]